MAEHLLAVKNLYKRYGLREVVCDVSFALTSGQVTGLLGPNGAGKTTSFYMVMGLIQPDSGQVLFDSGEIANLPMYKRAKLGITYLPQEPSVFRKLTVSENIMAVLEYRDLSKGRRNEILEKVLHDLNITHLRDAKACNLSGGERRRVEVARALATEPAFMLLDEPFAGIDPIAVAALQSIIRTLKDQNIGILITDHNVRETLNICDYAYLLQDGRIIEKGTSLELVSSRQAREVYLGENFRL
ncbi:MAG: LPS export ABC transporter ATP-binding protein [Deltaproteobacteria bacterium]|nr:LPS export ABC transporter ATP-binding protein [Deltaproteobacteria bacterium]